MIEMQVHWVFNFFVSSFYFNCIWNYSNIRNKRTHNKNDLIENDRHDFCSIKFTVINYFYDDKYNDNIN